MGGEQGMALPRPPLTLCLALLGEVERGGVPLHSLQGARTGDRPKILPMKRLVN